MSIQKRKKDIHDTIRELMIKYAKEDNTIPNQSDIEHVSNIAYTLITNKVDYFEIKE